MRRGNAVVMRRGRNAVAMRRRWNAVAHEEEGGMQSP